MKRDIIRKIVDILGHHNTVDAENKQYERAEDMYDTSVSFLARQAIDIYEKTHGGIQNDDN